MAKLNDFEKDLLEIVTEFAGDNENMIRGGIIKALIGQNDNARRKYLWNILDRRAREKIRTAKRKVAREKEKELVF